MTQQRKKAPKGTVQIKTVTSSVKVEWLRLVWSYQGKRYFLSLGLEDNPLNRMIAQKLALQIQGDIVTGNFDPTLAKYKSPEDNKPKIATLDEILTKYLVFKSLQIESETLDKYRSFLPRIKEFFINKPVTEKTAFEFRDWLSGRNQPITVKERIVFLNAAYQWAESKGMTPDNPWVNVSIKVPPKRPPKPFTLDEIHRILEAFRVNEQYSHYYPYVEFLFVTGCRPGEANGLQWKHVAEDCSEVLICCKLTKSKERKTTKTNRDRLIPLPLRLQQTLLRIRPQSPDPESPVFTSLFYGNPIDARGFQRRAWKTILTQLGIPYRKPGNTRHTMISHGLQQGKSAAELAELAGNRIETIYNNYAGSVIHRPQLPDLLSEEE